jgi:hypothetical protein
MLLMRSPKVDDGDELNGVKEETGNGSRCWSWFNGVMAQFPGVSNGLQKWSQECLPP